jgi:hypothetical protein
MVALEVVWEERMEEADPRIHLGHYLITLVITGTITAVKMGEIWTTG